MSKFFDPVKIVADAAGLPLDVILDALHKGLAQVPGVDPDAAIAKIMANLPATALLEAGQAALAELGDISHGHLNPRQHASDDI